MHCNTLWLISITLWHEVLTRPIDNFRGKDFSLAGHNKCRSGIIVSFFKSLLVICNVMNVTTLKRSGTNGKKVRTQNLTLYP